MGSHGRRVVTISSCSDWMLSLHLIARASMAALSRSASVDKVPLGFCAYTAVAAARARTAATHTRRYTRYSLGCVLDVCGICRMCCAPSAVADKVRGVKHFADAVAASSGTDGAQCTDIPGRNFGSDETLSSSSQAGVAVTPLAEHRRFCSQAGLLTRLRPASDAFPYRLRRYSDVCPRSCLCADAQRREAHSSGTVRDLHPIPF